MSPTAPAAGDFYALDGPAPVACPSTSAVSCTQIGTGNPNTNYHDNIACENGNNFGNGQFIGPGQTFQLDNRPLGNLQARTRAGTECLIHASGASQGQGQDGFNGCTIIGGANNPNPALQLVSNISRSDSVVTVPVFDLPAGGWNPTAQLPIKGLLQLGIVDVMPGGAGIDAVILNVACLDPASTGTPRARRQLRCDSFISDPRYRVHEFR